MWTWLRERSAHVNFWVSIILFFVGLVVAYVGKPEILATHEFAQWVFWFWTGQWFVFAAIYGVVIRRPNQAEWLLLLVDLQSILMVASAWVFLQGDDFRLLPLVVTLVVVYGVLLLINFFANPWNIEKPELSRRLLWIGPSETLASLAMPFLGFAVFIRYHMYGIPFLLAAIGYGALQRATYSSTFISSVDFSKTFTSTRTLYLLLATGKLLSCGLFYGLFFLLLPGYPNVIPALSDVAEQTIRGRIGSAASWAVGTILLPIIVVFVQKWLSGAFKHREASRDHRDPEN